MHIENWIILGAVQILIVLLTAIGVLLWLRHSTKTRLLEAWERSEELEQTIEKDQATIAELTSAAKQAKKSATKQTNEIKSLTTKLAEAQDPPAQETPAAEDNEYDGDDPSAGPEDVVDEETQVSDDDSADEPADAIFTDADEEIAEMKKLLQQFTIESRDMLNCIDQLQKENAALQAAAGTGAPAPLAEEIKETVDDAVSSVEPEANPETETETEEKAVAEPEPGPQDAAAQDANEEPPTAPST